MREQAILKPSTDTRKTALSPALPLEDEYVDILNKAQRGLGLTLDELAERAQVSVPLLQAIKGGQFAEEDALKKVAFVLNLSPERLLASARKQWAPEAVEAFEGFAMFTTDYGDMTVNAYLVWDPKTKEAATFDTGASARPILDFVAQHPLNVTRIFITHTHMDHLADLDRLLQAYPEARAYGSAIENPLGLKPLAPGHALCLGSLRIGVLGTHGHTPGGLSYFIEGLKRQNENQPLVISGDALFAGSMGGTAGGTAGGAAYAYENALENNRRHLLSLPRETVLCPGHGPLSTIAEQRHNPFFPEYV
ncbi:MAG: MBL fold metallo-hydrolase [Vampirovibrionales bacterium]|nr:MBL fold metallo-hydrolase [Vampirovibrionales bacterium]